jgi:hypothetical protein
MELKMTNKTESTQQIMFCDGSCSNVFPGGDVLIKEEFIFPEEFLRLKKFFQIEEIKEEVKEPIIEKKEYSKPIKTGFMSEKSEEKGGIE